MTDAIIEPLRSGDTELALHTWAPERPLAAIFYVHGVQSHGGWLFETGPEWSRMGIAVYVLDRRGCGRSGGPRGDTPSFHAWLDDYHLAMDVVRRRHAGIPLVLLGQSMGAAIAVGLVSDGEERHDALVLAAPPLGRRAATLTAEQRAAILADRSDDLRKVELKDEIYTRDDRYLSILRADERMTRFVTARHRAASLELEDFYLARLSAAARRPSMLIYAKDDPLLHLPTVRDLFATLGRTEGVVVELPYDAHYLEFSPWRNAFREIVASYAIAGGLRPLAAPPAG